MKKLLGLASIAGLLLVSGCEGPAVGGAYGVYGESPYIYGGTVYPDTYGYAYPYYSPYAYGTYPYYGPYDRDHYWDRGRHFEQHRWHPDSGWGQPRRDFNRGGDRDRDRDHDRDRR